MKVSVCITTYNEEKTIKKLILSLIKQSLKSDEIVIVDGLSTDKTVLIIKKLQRKYPVIKLVSKKCTRSEGRNMAVKMAKNEIIAMTDAGCRARRNWLKNIVKPFSKGEGDMVAGFYNMTGTKSIQKAFSVFLGTDPYEYDVDFIPSTRSIAFTKKVFSKIGGFREDIKDTAEDTAFTSKAIQIGVKIIRVKNARVEWAMPSSVMDGVKKMYKYAKGDAKYGQWKHPSKGYMSHNMKSLSVILRYLLAFFVILRFMQKYSDLRIVILLITFYFSWAYRKVFKRTRSIPVSLWGVVIQIMSDFAVMAGFIVGYFTRG